MCPCSEPDRALSWLGPCAAQPSSGEPQESPLHGQGGWAGMVLLSSLSPSAAGYAARRAKVLPGSLWPLLPPGVTGGRRWYCRYSPRGPW